MDKVVLLQSQKNEILELIKQKGLDPLNFNWEIVLSEETLGLKVSRLNYRGSALFFLFDRRRGGHSGGFLATFSPGKERLIETYINSNWDGQRGSFKQWLQNLRREIEQPDLWAEVAKYQLPPGVRVGPQATNEPFSADEAEQLSSTLREIHNLIVAQGEKTEEQIKTINERLEYLTDAVKRLGKRDWINTCIGVLVQTATQFALAPEQAAEMWERIKCALGGIIQSLPK